MAEANNNEEIVKCPICGLEWEGKYPQLIEFIMWRVRDRMRELFFEED